MPSLFLMMALVQAPPGTDVFLVDLRVAGSGLTVGKPANLTRRAGYDNQPSFAPDGRSLFFTSVREGGPGGTTQADIYRIDLATGRTAAFTATPESEYSATVVPGGRDVSVIRVEVDSTQRLWAFPLAGGSPRVLLERIRPVGYQVWVDPTTVGIFVLGSPATLQLADLATGTSRPLLADIGRSLQLAPGRRAITVSHRPSQDVWWAVDVDLATGKTTPIVRLPEGADYFVWLPDRSLLTAAGSSLWRYRPGTDREFAVVATVEGVRGITRLAVSPKGNQLALVGEDQP